jgi:hypothetical protein
MSTPQRRFSTGMEILDRRLDGGLPVGTMVAFTAPPWSQSELVLAQFAREQPLHYVSMTVPDETELRGRFTAALGDTPRNLAVHHLRPAELLDDPAPLLETITPESYVVLDPVTPLETAEPEAYLGVLNALKKRLVATESIGILHCLDARSLPQGRAYSQHRADFCWRLDVTDTGREIKSRLLVTKARGYRAFTEPLPLVLTDQVRIDTSRGIV